MYEKIITYVNEKQKKFGELSFNDLREIAEATALRVSDVVICEAMETEGLTYDAVMEGVYNAFAYNLSVMEIGMKETSTSYILGDLGSQMKKLKEQQEYLFHDEFVNDAIIYTLAAQVGNHGCGLEPCAGTGDSTVLTGVVKALINTGKDRDIIGRSIALMLKLATFYRVGKCSTGCNMEGIGAGAVCTAAAVTEMNQATPEQFAKAVCLAVSPTVANPCVPKIVVQGLCSAHIGSAVCIGYLAAQMSMMVDFPCMSDMDTMFAMTAKVHIASAKNCAPVAAEYMTPYYHRKEDIEKYVNKEDLDHEMKQIDEVLEKVHKEVHGIARQTTSIIRPFGLATVGGSSLGVGSPTNMGRIAYQLLEGKKPNKIVIDLYHDHFIRRSRNIPGILMGALLGADTSDITSYRSVMEQLEDMDVEIHINCIDEPSLQRIRIEYDKGYVMVDSRARGGGRIAIADAYPSKAAAVEAAERLGMVVVE